MSIDPLGFVRRQGIVLESAKGAVPNLAEAVAGCPIRGNWWNHAKGKEIFRATRLVRDAEGILVCRLINGKVTYVDRRLWPAVVRLAECLGKDALTAIREQHSASGAHVIKELPFPQWVPSDVRSAADALSEAQAAALLGSWTAAILQSRKPRSRKTQIRRQRHR